MISTIPALPGVSEGRSGQDHAQLGSATGRATHLLHALCLYPWPQLFQHTVKPFHNSQCHIHLWGPRGDGWNGSWISGARGTEGWRCKKCTFMHSFFDYIFPSSWWWALAAVNTCWRASKPPACPCHWVLRTRNHIVCTGSMVGTEQQHYTSHN